MQIYFLTVRQTSESDQFFKQLASLGAEYDILFLRKLIDPKSNFKCPFLTGDLVVLYINSEEELRRLVAIQEALAHCLIILILPNGRTKIIHQGLQLSPRFIDDKNGDQKILMQVIHNIYSRNRKNYAWKTHSERTVIKNDKWEMTK